MKETWVVTLDRKNSWVELAEAPNAPKKRLPLPEALIMLIELGQHGSYVEELISSYARLTARGIVMSWERHE